MTGQDHSHGCDLRAWKSSDGSVPTKWRGEWECGLRFEGHLGRVGGKQKILVMARTYPEGGERRNRICTEEVIDSQVSERYGRHFGRWRDHKILLRSKRVNKSSLENFVKNSDKLAIMCCLENGLVLESRVCILLDFIRAVIFCWEYYMYCRWNLGLACLLDPNLFHHQPLWVFCVFVATLFVY